MKRWTLLFCLTAAFCVTLAAADMAPTPLNCHEMAALWFDNQDEAQLLDASDGAEAALSDYFAAREAAYRGDMRLLSADESGMSEAVAANNALRMERVGEMEDRLGFTVLDADVTTRIERESTVRNPDGTLTLCVYEWTFYDYDDLSDGQGGLDVSGFGAWHILTVAEGPNGCEILSDEYDESDVLGINALSAERQQELLDRASADAVPEYGAEPDEDAASLLAISYYPDYDVSKAVAYSEQYWENYNPAYANFNNLGGDCANFTSQSIYAGGMPQVVTKPYSNDGWYYKTSTDRSATWTGANNLHHWMRDNRGHCVTASKTTVYTGSPVFYSTKGDGTFQHAVLCVGTNSAGTPIINSHNSDRYHVMWNYYTGSVDIETVQLTSKSFGDFSGYVKLDADFYAYIANPSLNRYVTNDGGGAVSSRARNEQAEAGQVWRFTRQDDGSYQIVSALKDGTQKTPALAASEGGWASRTPVCTENDAGEPGQRWYLYLDGNQFSWGSDGYQLRPKCSDRVLDIFEGSDADGADMWIFSKQSSLEDRQAQLFQIKETQWVELDPPKLNVALEGSEGANVAFSWEAVSGAVSYRLQVTQGDKQVKEATPSRALSCAMKLEPGEYQAVLQAYSANKRTSSVSEPVSFTVLTSYTITFYPNGGEGEPIEQMKIEQVDATLSEEIPVRKGYDFVSWNTQANDTGTSYLPGAVYAVDDNLTLYAQWEPAQFTVTLDPNGGALSEEQRQHVVTYKEPYGEALSDKSAPELKDNEFIGWFTELADGEQLTEESEVNFTEDHTLYAHWESSIPTISPFVTKNGSQHNISATLYRIPYGVIFACGYLNGQFIAAVSKDVADTQDMFLDGDFDTILIMALDDTNNMRPLCESKSVPKSAFRGN